MIDHSPIYKRMCFLATEIQHSWIPEEGDHWACSCTSCLESGYLWTLDHHDVMAIDPKYTLENLKTHYYRDVVSCVMTSRDFGFGQFWADWQINQHLGHVWLPRFDQLMNFAGIQSTTDRLVTLKIHEFAEYLYFKQTECNEKESLEQLALQWIMERVYNKRYKENSDKPIMPKEEVEERVKPEGMTDEAFEMYKSMLPTPKYLTGKWFEIKTAGVD